MPDSQSRRLAAILAADIVGYSALMGADEARTVRDLKEHQAAVLPMICAFDGRIIDTAGDGILAAFASIVNAVECAVAIQNTMRERNASVEPARRMQLRIGIDFGDVICDEERIYGDGVNIAARLQTIAEPGGVCISGKVYEEVRRKLDLAFADIGDQKLKNIAQPIHGYRLVARAAAESPSGAAGSSNGKATALPGKPSIAVLPFTNMSNDPEQEYFSDGITEDITTDLSKISALHVVARNTAFTYKGKAIKVEQVARELGVRFVLEGSVRKVAARVRVTGQLIDGESGAHVWAERYDRDLTDIFAIQDEITQAIVDQLKVRLLPEEKKVIAQVPTESVEAYAYYLRGRQFLHRRSKTFLELARRMFVKAVEIDPLYAKAYAGIADCDSFLRLHYGADVSIDGILAMSAKALELKSGLAEAHASRGLALSLLGRYPEAMAEFDEAFAVDPDLFEAHYFCARACFTQGRLEDAARHFRRAADIKPDDCQTLLVLTGVLRSLGRRDEMLAAAREGVARAERELALHPENPRPAYLGAGGLAILGEIDRAKEWAARALAIDPDDILTQYNGACFYAIVGDQERAIDLLLAVLPRAGRQTKEWVKYDSDFDSLRSNPRFARVLELIG
jgi:adenylate cyclase